MATLASYINDTRDKLHDLSGSFWSDSQIASYVNEARTHTVWKTKCYRFLQPFATVANVESYDFSLLPQNLLGNKTLDVLNINLINGSDRFSLRWKVFTDFNAWYRTNTTQRYMPECFSLYGQSTFYLGCTPDQIYPLELDTVIVPPALSLASPSVLDVIIDPYTSPVKYYAASMAKIYQQQFTDADRFMRLFDSDVDRVLRGVRTRRIDSAYPDMR